MEDVQRSAKNRDKEHVPAWREWAKRLGFGAMGIWHETYVVEPGTYECVYHHMPPFGLGRVGPLVAAEGPLQTAPQRLGKRAESKADAA